MSRFLKNLPSLASVFLLTACASLVPVYERPTVPLPITFSGNQSPSPIENLILWKNVFDSPDLQKLTDLALSENRDIRIALANIDIAKARYGITTADRYPVVNASASQNLSDSSPNSASYRNAINAKVGINAYEFDFFGRVKYLNDAALQSYLSTIEGERAARILIAASVAENWLRLAASREQLALAEETELAQSQSLKLSEELFRAGISNELDVRRASSSVENARAEAESAKAQVLKDLNALRLAVGAELPADTKTKATLLLNFDVLSSTQNLSSSVLLNRPDVLEAERTLQKENANIGSARAAMFPKITLTSEFGLASSDLFDLVDDGVGFFNFGPQIDIPIFDAGARRKNIELSKANRNLALAQYEQTIQTAFRETADAYAVAMTIDKRISALEQLSRDAQQTLYLSEERFKVGVDDYLSVLDSQRTTFSAKQSLISARLDKALNQVAIYKAIGAAPE